MVFNFQSNGTQFLKYLMKNNRLISLFIQQTICSSKNTELGGELFP